MAQGRLDIVRWDAPRARHMEHCASDTALIASRKRGDENVLNENTAFLGGKPALPIIRRYFVDGLPLSPQAACRILAEARAIMAREPNVVSVRNQESRAIVVGDIHGQFYDLLQIMDMESLPCADKTVIFLGDYVDRGSFSTEVLFYLCACKILFPNNVVLLRGNHESPPMCDRDGFSRECEAKYPDEVFDSALRLFTTLPLCALIIGTPYGDCLCAHGGIGPGIATIADIAEIERFIEVPEDGAMSDLLWADPMPERTECKVVMPAGSAEVELTQEAWEQIVYVPNTDRNTSWFYGAAAVLAFLKTNRLSCIIRGHQVQELGFKGHFSEGAGLPRVITIFSAPNYCDAYDNVGAFLRISAATGFQVQQIRAVDHPYVLPDFQDAFTYSIPTITETVVTTIQALVNQIVMERAQGVSMADSLWDEVLSYKVKKLYEKADKLRELKKEMLTVSVPENLSKFQLMLLRDKKNEQRATPLSHSRRKISLLRTFSSST